MSAAPDSYDAYLDSRWPARDRVLCTRGLLLTVFLAGLEWLGALEAGRAHGWAQLLPRLAPALLAPLGFAVALLPPSHRLLQPLSLLLGFGYALGCDLGFYVLGTQGSLLQGVVFYLCVLSLGTVLPLRRGQRRLLNAAFLVTHVALELLWPDGRTLGARLLACAQLGTGAFTLAMVLELFFQNHRRNFELRREMQATVQVLTDNRGRIGAAAEELAGSVGELGQSARSLESRMERTREESHQMASASEQIARSAQALLQRSRSSAATVAEAAQYAATVDGLVLDLEQRVAELARAVGHSEQRLGQLEQNSQRIGRFVETVQEIAAQTHTLAVNAGIEAAQAGEWGRGFSVIATEVRQLAGQVGRSSREVSSVVAELGTQMASTVGAMGEVRERTSECQAVFEDARASLQGIQSVVGAMSAATGDNASDAVAQAQGTSDISQGTARLLELVQAQAQLSAEVAHTSASLGQLAGSLRALLPAEEAPAPRSPARM